MAMHPRAGQPAELSDRINIAQLVAAYYVNEPDPRQRSQQVQFGTSGHRGSALDKSFNEAHILAIAQAICAYREEQGISGPILLAKDTHALSEPAYLSALDVFLGNGLTVHVQTEHDYTPTPSLSRAVIAWNAKNPKQQADGVVITPSHNPPQDGGFKYNPPHGGPADTDATRTIEKYANALLSSDLMGVQTCEGDVLKHPRLVFCDWRSDYIEALTTVIDMDAISQANLALAVDAMGGAGSRYWQQIAQRYQLNLDIFNAVVDPQFGFMCLDKDGKIRMDCSSPSAMASLLQYKDNYALAFGNDPDFDRHGIVSPDVGLMNPNHYLTVAIDYLCQHRQWSATAAIGKTLVSSALIDKVVAQHQRPLLETPVGFKWFAQGLHDGSLVFAGEESAGATLATRSGDVWTTDKDGIVMALLAAEIVAATGKTPAQYYQALCQQHGTGYYRRVDTASSAEQNRQFGAIRAYKVKLEQLAGDAVTAIDTKAKGNGAVFGGIKVETAKGWFAARPSGTEPVYKIYAESFVDEAHLDAIISEAQAWVNELLQ